ncbi:hypothetical protein BaRGS_00034754 [Batillaria attramentaria]|uniref:protein-histidine N-methyltransferase n=1 Tax=Batillaria attramentaria TaxID=370345 RepID=A0ABD0JGT0_9CAEN
MSAFRFNFAACSEEEDKQTADDTVDASCQTGGDTNQGAPAAVEVEWIPVTQIKDVTNASETVADYNFGCYCLQTVSATSVEKQLLQEKSKWTDVVVSAVSSHSDLVAGQYEGGLKIWECSVDLCHYMADSDVLGAGSRVLELGCGGALPGILAAKMGASSVHFQDFNKEVLELYTMPNIHLNNLDRSTCTFFSGDWGSFVSLALHRKHVYDVILTSETIYSVASYPKLHNVFTSLLASSGTVYPYPESEFEDTVVKQRSL